MTDATSESAAASDAAASAPAPATTAPSGSTGAAADAVAAQSGEAPPSRTFWASLNHPFALGFFVTLGALVALVLGLAVSNLSTVIIYVVFALFAALGLDPVVRFLERHGVTRAWSIVIVFTGFAVILVGVLWLIIPTVVQQISQFIRDIPALIANFQSSALFAWLQDNLGDQVGDILKQIQGFLTNPSNIAAIGGGVVKVGITIGTTISGLIIVLVLSLYFLASLPAMKVSFARLTPARNRPTVTSITEQITSSIGGYLGGMVVLAFFNSIVAFLLYTFLGLPFPLLMAVVAFSITLIPLVGSVLFWIIGSMIALFSSPLGALIFAIIYLIYMQIEAYVLTPRVMNKAVSVPGSLVVIGALVGGTLLGLLGALVAIPVTASILLIIKQVLIPRQDAKV
ncbi:AI-2E family transporter [Microbacterium elymi]|uniref:AI-2E family transporter n=1 Tax=Microbacterium elymi TaxID=2909587 RepID=A0ABY5NGU7_9MICO|nr:AI-2E family transporter [Microbacterium elymi]UUT34373.1 AI-2E family transporter [Microbacterium elymi]